MVNNSVNLTMDIAEDLTLVQEVSPASRKIDEGKVDLKLFNAVKIKGLNNRNIVHSKARFNKY